MELIPVPFKYPEDALKKRLWYQEFLLSEVQRWHTVETFFTVKAIGPVKASYSLNHKSMHVIVY